MILRFGFNILAGEILTAARYGVWSYHHGDNDFYRGGPPHFWGLCERAPLSGVILQVLTEELDGGPVLCKSLFTTEQTSSVSRNRYVPYWGSTDLVIRKVNELHQFGWDYVRQKSVPPAPFQGKRKIYRTPTNLEMVRWMGPVILKKTLEYPFRKKTVQHWKIAVRVGHTPLFDSPDPAWRVFAGLNLHRIIFGRTHLPSCIRKGAGLFSKTTTIRNGGQVLPAQKFHWTEA